MKRFVESMSLDHDRWRDGIGYDLEALRAATPQERAQIEALLVNRPVSDWREVEALAALDTPVTRARLRAALAEGDPEITTAITRFAPSLASGDERTAVLVEALKSATAFGGLTETLDQIEAFHPPEVLDALWLGVLTRDGETAVHLAAMLLFLYGEADEAFDWNHRPFFLEFHTEDAGERRRQFDELCRRVDLDADALVARIT